MADEVVARDMLRLVAAFAKTDRGKTVEDVSLITYWGFSCGSSLAKRLHRCTLIELTGLLLTAGLNLIYHDSC